MNPIPVILRTSYIFGDLPFNFLDSKKFGLKNQGSF
jgi:hypothetical protein